MNLPKPPGFLNQVGQGRTDFKDPEKYVFKSSKGLNRRIVQEISAMKNEPQWMLEFRLKALEQYEKMPMRVGVWK